MSDPYVYLNGEVVPLESATVSPLDRGFLYGDGLFETLRTAHGRPYRLREHLARLRAGGEAIRLDADLDEEETARVLYELRRRNALDEMYMRITVTRGRHRGSLELAGGERTVFIYVKELALPPARLYEEGVAVTLRRTSAGLGHRPLPVKSTSYITNLAALDEARRNGFYEALAVSERGEILEGATSNVFFAGGGTLITPVLETGILPGVTRGVVLELAREAGLRVVERPVFTDLLATCDEAFLTNSLVGVLAVSRIDDLRMKVRADGTTARLKRSYDQDVQKQG